MVSMVFARQRPKLMKKLSAAQNWGKFEHPEGVLVDYDIKAETLTVK